MSEAVSGAKKEKRKYDLLVRSDDRQYTAYVWFSTNYITIAVTKRNGDNIERVTRFRIVSDPVLLSLVKKRSLVHRLRDHLSFICDEFRS